MEYAKVLENNNITIDELNKQHEIYVAGDTSTPEAAIALAQAADYINTYTTIVAEYDMERIEKISSYERIVRDINENFVAEQERYTQAVEEYQNWKQSQYDSLPFDLNEFRQKQVACQESGWTDRYLDMSYLQYSILAPKDLETTCFRNV